MLYEITKSVKEQILIYFKCFQPYIPLIQKINNFFFNRVLIY